MTPLEILNQAIAAIQAQIVQLENIRNSLGGAGVVSIGNPNVAAQAEINKLSDALNTANKAVEQMSNRCFTLEAENAQLKQKLADAVQRAA